MPVAADDVSLFQFAYDATDGKRLKVVAFKDVNDLLGFRAGGHFSENAATLADFVEVRHQNASVYLKAFAWPPAAHASEDEHEDSAKMIWCGALAGKKGNLSPRDCNK